MTPDDSALLTRCPECGYDYGSTTATDAADRIRIEAARVAELMLPADPELARRRRGPVWSAAQYTGHMRDMMIAQRERVLMARAGTSRTVVPTSRDERVRWGEYDGFEPSVLARDVQQTAGWLAHTLDRLEPENWLRTVDYNYPVPAERDVLWIAAHTVHELVHHRADIEQALAGPST